MDAGTHAQHGREHHDIEHASTLERRPARRRPSRRIGPFRDGNRGRPPPVFRSGGRSTCIRWTALLHTVAGYRQVGRRSGGSPRHGRVDVARRRPGSDPVDLAEQYRRCSSRSRATSRDPRARRPPALDPPSVQRPVGWTAAERMVADVSLVHPDDQPALDAVTAAIRAGADSGHRARAPAAQGRAARLGDVERPRLARRRPPRSWRWSW